MRNRFVYEARRPFRLREWLKATGLSQQKLANALGVDKGTISKWISEPWRVNIDAISAIADVMKLSDPGDLFRLPSSVLLPEQKRQLRNAAETVLKTLE